MTHKASKQTQKQGRAFSRTLNFLVGFFFSFESNPKTEIPGAYRFALTGATVPRKDEKFYKCKRLRAQINGEKNEADTV